jgi:hypothetical protein
MDKETPNTLDSDLHNDINVIEYYLRNNLKDKEINS